MGKLRILLLAATLPLAVAWAGDSETDALAWLQRVANAAHQLSYAGKFIYQHGNQVETSRIVHVVDETGQHEKLVTLDGTPRQIYRVNDEVYHFLPDDKTVVVDHHRVRTGFPALLPRQIAELKDYYQISLGGPDRVAGRDVQVIVLEPRDQYRYGHRLFADAKTGLLLKASTWDDKKQLVDQFAFTDVSIGGPIDKSEVKPPLAGRKLVRSTGEGVRGGAPVDPGWEVGAVPPGFKRVSAIKRVLPGQNMPVNQFVFSDGLAAASVFIGPAPPGNEAGLAQQGSIHVYTRRIADHQVKVVGEVPPATVIRIGDSVARK